MDLTELIKQFEQEVLGQESFEQGQEVWFVRQNDDGHSYTVKGTYQGPTEGSDFHSQIFAKHPTVSSHTYQNILTRNLFSRKEDADIHASAYNEVRKKIIPYIPKPLEQ